MVQKTEEQNWQHLKIIKDFFQIQENGEMPDGSRLLLDAMDLAVFRPGMDLVTVGDSAEDGMYIILEGNVRVLAEDETLLNELGEGDVVGELALVKDGSRKATVRAATEVSCAHISRGLFREIADTNKKVYAVLLELLYTKTTNMVRERERMRSELEIASRIQTGFLPKSFERFCGLPNVKITACMKAAREVGGDFYDVFLIDENRLCFLIADVAGKGVPASLFMTVAKIHIKNYMALDMPLAEMAGRVNSQLNEDNQEELFVTAFICVLDTLRNQLSFVNAGHNKPYLSRKGGAFRLLDCQADFVLGIMENMPYHEQTIALEPGDRFYLYTDGVTEAFDVNGEMFTDAGLEQALNRHMAVAGDPECLLEAMYQELSDFSRGADQSDDITMVYVAR